MKIVFLDRKTIGDIPALAQLEKYGEVLVYDTTLPNQTIDRVKQANVIITNKVLITQEVIDSAPDLKLICIAATGMNNVDVNYAKGKGVQVKNVTDYSTDSVAQSTFAMILYLLNKTAYFDNYVKTGQYSSSEIFTHHGRTFWQLSGKYFGIIGMGNIGQRVAAIAEAFGAKINYYSTSGKNLKQAYPVVSLEDLLSNSDVLSIHAPLNENTQNLISYKELIKMQKHAILINMGRGGIVNEEDLARALNENRIAGAGLDVFIHEPMEKDNPLLMINDPEKILFSPHIAWASLESRTLLIEKICINIEDYARPLYFD